MYLESRFLRHDSVKHMLFLNNGNHINNLSNVLLSNNFCGIKFINEATLLALLYPMISMILFAGLTYF